MQPEYDEVARVSDPRREHIERRSEARRQRVLRENPETGEFLLAMSDEPTAESAFDHGAPWQRWVAELLREAFPKGVFLFHRRRGPGRHDDIDVVAVLPSGVWIIDIRRYEGARAEVRYRGGVRSGAKYLAVDDTDATAVLDNLDDQARAVAAALTNAGWEQVETHSVLCLVDVEPTWRGHTTLGAAHVTKARPMLKLLAAGPDVLDDTDIASLGLSLDKALARQHPGR
jgi:nuclease-like protein